MYAAQPHATSPLALNGGLAAAEPSERDMLSMSDDEYMNDTQLAFFRKRLQALRASVEERTRKAPDEDRDTELMLPDPADQASLEQETALEWRVRDLDRQWLKRIDEALSRIDAGDYGWCEETGDPIGIPRLLASPTATMTVEAQARQELRQRLFRH